MAFTDTQHAYQRPSRIQADLEQVSIHLAPDHQQAPAHFQGELRDPLRFREALSVLYAVMTSDMRFKAKDRTNYLQHIQRQAAQGRMSQEAAARLRKAQQHLQEQLQAEDEAPDSEDALDPLLSVHPDEAFLEVFSTDESIYGRLALNWDLFQEVKDLQYGTTHIDFSPALHEALQNLRSYKNAVLSLDPVAAPKKKKKKKNDVDVEAEDLPPKQLHVPDTWLRGFLQVQSAATLPMTHFRLKPIDLYNIMAYLRRHKSKKSPRGLRFELLPGQSPRIILEPWEKVFFSRAEAYAGKEAQVVRTWGRRRLLLLERLLPFTQAVDVYTLGSGLPTFYVLDMGSLSFTIGLSGWTANDWSSSAYFDTLFPQAKLNQKLSKQIESLLQDNWHASIEELSEDLGKPTQTIRAHLQHASRQGRVIYDLHNQRYRYRVLPSDFDVERLRFRNPREELAHQILNSTHQGEPILKITKINHVWGQGTEIHAEVNDHEAFREYQLSFFLDMDGRLSKAKCTCQWFQQTKFKEGPCEHILAARLLYAQQREAEEERRRSGADREIIVAETRSFTRRQGEREQVQQMTLDHRQLRLQWGTRGQKLRRQTLLFNSEAEARSDYFLRIDQLADQGYVASEL